ncbi:MAG: DJ-1/PfpI family protein [Prevotellaceae bacterium]|jgi:4-methyl-5(b-hydroxyethyl)-thiazole monophosphate biosynthesis|nr:DJ-1/PfpI family protein [Prevotellaceae bacterium]
MKTVIFLADGFEEMEATCAIDILRRAGVDVVTASITERKEVVAAHNVTFVSDKMFDEIDFSDVEMLVLPGGMPGAANLSKHEGLCSLLLDFNDSNMPIAAICAAPSVVLGGLRLLKGKEAICYPGFEAGMRAQKISEKTVVTDGNITTAKGPGVAMQFALELVRILKNEQTAEKIKKDLCLL